MINLQVMEKKLKKFMYENEHIFLTVLDNNYLYKKKLLLNKKKISYDENKNIQSLLFNYRNSLFLKTISSDLKDYIKLINNYDFFYLYTTSEIFTNLLPYLEFDFRLIKKYYVMTLDLNTNITPIYTTGVFTKPCSIEDFEYLKDLQKLYHLEEVYESTAVYPYEAEMQQFKKILKTRINYSLYLNNNLNYPISKIYVNGETIKSYQIGGVYTRKNYRKMGYGKICLTDFIRYIQNNTTSNKERIILFVNINNKAAINLYKSAGFKIIDQTTTAYKK